MINTLIEKTIRSIQNMSTLKSIIFFCLIIGTGIFLEYYECKHEIIKMIISLILVTIINLFIYEII